MGHCAFEVVTEKNSFRVRCCVKGKALCETRKCVLFKQLQKSLRNKSISSGGSHQSLDNFPEMLKVLPPQSWNCIKWNDETVFCHQIIKQIPSFKGRTSQRSRTAAVFIVQNLHASAHKNEIAAKTNDNAFDFENNLSFCLLIHSNVTTVLLGPSAHPGA